MSTPAQIGKNEYKAAVTKCRNANREARCQLKRIISETNSNLIRALVGNVLLALSENDEAVERLDEIGRNTKHFDN
ncbi:MAG: hypothetical protein EHM40_03355 [Chloroflexi bacterium]|nr:MAG: hypothetical protein EHM40_03355 [Chloroflexota bacterium]